MALPYATNRWIAGHLTEGFYVVSQQKRLLAHARGRKRSLGSGMATTNNNNVKF
jgi:hypothetical protein